MDELGFSASDVPSVAPPPRKRQTIASEAAIEGRGIHSGIQCRMTLLPAEPGTGLCFQRVDLAEKPLIPCTYDHLAEEELERRTTLRKGPAAVHTIEHVVSALAAMQIDDAIIQMDAAEPPFADGSALPFAELIRSAGIQQSSREVDPIVITRPIAFAFGGSEVCAIPSSEFRVSFFFTSEHPNLRSQSHSAIITPESYLGDIAPARTFCFFDEIEALRKAGLIKGANLSSAVVIGRKGIINDSLRFQDEPVRHKILDFVGDMSLLGSPLQGHFMAWRAGHRVNAAFGKYLKKELEL